MSSLPSFESLELAPLVLKSIAQLGYETPTPIQAASIPHLLSGKDVLAQAQTGTGKTAAFVLPILSNITLSLKAPQAIIVTPTRELAIQVAEACQSYAHHLKQLQVTPLYGGQDYSIQLKALKRGPHIIVGTPGRLMDHLRRTTLNTEHLKTVILDEADEMLKMGFIDDVSFILEQVPMPRQTALFSATLPRAIEKIAERYLHHPEKIRIKPSKSTTEAIEQYYIPLPRNQKLEALTRFLEVEDRQAVIIFVRTKTLSAELAEKLQARGYAAAPLNGDMSQSLREKTVDRLRKNRLDIIIATDVAARGIDVERVTHVINFDIPYDVESYIHRIGRTGRAGRKGKAILFVSARERRMLNELQRAIKQPIIEAQPPSLAEMTEKREAHFAEKVRNIIEKSKRLAPHAAMVKKIAEHSGHDYESIATALVYLLQQTNPLPESDTIETCSLGQRPDKKRFSKHKATGKPRRKPRPSTGQGAKRKKTRPAS